MAFATTTELAAGWRPLAATEQQWATLLLGAAERWIRRRRPDIADDDPDAKVVTLAVVRDALVPGEFAGHSSYSRTLGPRAKAGALTNPDAALVWADWMKDLLGIPTGTSPLGSFGNGGHCERW